MFSASPTLDLICRGLFLTTMVMVWVVLLVGINGLK